MAEITASELELMLEARDDATFYRETRSHVLKSAVKRTMRRSGQLAERDSQSAEDDVHRGKARAYKALPVKLRSGR